MRHDEVFLRNPAEIRNAVKQLQGGARLDLAVAFVGPDWSELLAYYSGKLRVICWLSSTNTNPYAVEDLMNAPGTEVRQRTSMHAKVYYAPGIGAIVGSANLSKGALSEAEISGQDEAALLTNNGVLLNGIGAWFNALWRDRARTIHITPKDLDAAKLAWQRARRSSPPEHFRSPNGLAVVPPLPTTLDSEMLKYAKRVRNLDIERAIGECSDFVRSLDPRTVTRAECNELVDHLVSWTGHRASYNRFLSQSITGIRKGLAVLFDDGKDPQNRLEQIVDDGKLVGLRIPTLSMLLYWRKPDRFLPYNFRTVKFLQDFKLQREGMSASSPRCYIAWVRWATRLAQRLKLPTPGDIDRMVESYYEDYYD